MTELSALVTGSTSGIGRGIAEALAASGMNVMLNGFGDADTIGQLRTSLAEKHSVDVRYTNADLQQPGEIRRLADETLAAFGRVDVLVNNAGIQHVAPIDEFPEDKLNAIIAVNLVAAFHTVKACLPDMKKRGWGRIVNVASAHGLVASPYKSAYVAAKHGMLGLTKTVALETATCGVTCNAICPGYVLTPLVAAQVADTARVRGISEESVRRDIMLAAQPTGQFVGIDQVAALAVFLCSDAASQITGAALPVDGGWTAQ